MPAILRKSFTACEALAALPPTPRMNNRPSKLRVSASSNAAASILAPSRRSITSLASAKNCCVNVFSFVIFTSSILIRSSQQGTQPSRAIPPPSQSHKTAPALQTPRAGCVPAEPCKAQRGHKPFLPAHLEMPEPEKLPARNRCNPCAACDWSCCRRESSPLRTRRCLYPTSPHYEKPSSFPTRPCFAKKQPRSSARWRHSRTEDKNRHT